MPYHSDHRGKDACCCAHCSRAECSVPCDSSCMNTDKQNTVTALASQCAKQKILCRAWKKILSCRSISNSAETVNSLDETSQGIHPTF